MEGKFDRERRRVKRAKFSWAKRLMTPSSVRMFVAVVVGVTKVIAALYRFFNILRD